MSRKWFFIGLILGFLSFIALLFIVIAIKFGSEEVVYEEEFVAPKIDISSLQLTDLKGKTVKISDYYGKPVLLNFWATWCSPCVAEFPLFEKIQKEGKVQILTVSDQKIETIENFKNKKGYTFLFFKSTKELSDYGISAIPVSLFINSKGEVVSEDVGSDEKTLRETLKELN